MSSEELERRTRRHAMQIAFACGALYLALIVAAFGLLSLSTNTDVVSEPDIGELVGPSMAATAVVVVTGLLLLRRPRRSDIGLDWGYSLLVAASAMVSYTGAAFVGGVIDQGVEAGLHFGWVTAFGGYDVLIGILAFAVALLYSFVIARRYDERGRPRWTWEDDFDA